MKKPVTLIFISIINLIQVSAQICTGCTQTISGTYSTPIIAGSGDVICITASGVVNAPITVNGGISAGVICNMGIINGSITTTSGQINNYGTINASSISNGGGYPNTFRNYNIVNCLGNYNSSGSSQFFNYGGMKVDGTFFNNDVIAGPHSGCGGFSVLGGATNDGNFGYSFDLLDMCDSTNVGGWTVQDGGVGPDVTYCVCNDFCSTSIGIEENTTIISQSIVYPNPATDQITISIQSDPKHPYDVFVFNTLGKVQRVLRDNQTNLLNIPRQDLPAGIYFYNVVLQNQTIGSGKIVFN